MKSCILVLLVGLFLFSGCKKNYTCRCKIEDKDSTGYTYNKASYVVSDKSKSDDNLRYTCEPEAKAAHGIQPLGNPSGATRTFNCTVTED